jgi:hypothetical protein
MKETCDHFHLPDRNTGRRLVPPAFFSSILRWRSDLPMRPTTRFPWKVVPAAALLLYSAFLMPGCGSGDPAKNNKVGGKVTLDGKPAQYDKLALHYENGTSKEFELDENGGFNVQGVPLGKVKVTVTSKVPRVEDIREQMGKYPEKADMMKAMLEMAERLQNATGKEQTEMLKQNGTPLPSKYASRESSGLTWEITAGNNQKDFPLTAK